MSLGHHVILSGLVRVEHHLAALAWDSWEPMAFRIHVVIGTILSTEGAGTGFTLEGRCPVVYSVHMLIASGLGAEDSRACLTLNPVIVVIHVLIAILPIPEFCVTSAAFKHDERLKYLVSTWSERGDMKLEKRDGGGK
jgi:hypothetical protein